MDRSTFGTVLALAAFSISAAFLPSSNPANTATAVAGSALGFLWGVCRTGVLKHRAFALVGFFLLLWSSVILAAPSYRTWLLLPRLTALPAIYGGFLELSDAVLLEDTLPSLPVIRAVLFAVFVLSAAFAMSDTRHDTTVFRPMVLPVAAAALMAYRDGTRPVVVGCLLVSAGCVFFLYKERPLKVPARRDVSEWLTAALLLGLLLIGSGKFLAPTIERYALTPAREAMKPEDKSRVVKSSTHLSFDSVEDARKWVEQNVAQGPATNGDVSAVLEQGVGTPSQMDALAATILARGGVEISVMEDGSVKRRIVSAEATSVIPGSGSLPDSANTGSTRFQEPSASSTPASGSLPNPANTGSNQIEEPTPATTATSTPTEPPTTVAQPTATTASRPYRLVLLALALMLGASILLYAARRSLREVRRSRTDSEVIGAWRRIDALRQKRSGVVLDESLSFLERAYPLAPYEEDPHLASVIRELAALADADAYSPSPASVERATTLEREARVLLRASRDRTR